MLHSYTAYKYNIPRHSQRYVSPFATIRTYTRLVLLSTSLNTFGSPQAKDDRLSPSVQQGRQQGQQQHERNPSTQKPTTTRHTPTPLSWLSFRSLFWGDDASGGSASSPPPAAAGGDGSRFVNTRRRSIPASTGSGFCITVSPPHCPSSRIWCTSYDTAAVAALQLRARRVGVGWESCRHSQDDCCCCCCGMPVYPRGPPTVGTTRTLLLICLSTSTRSTRLVIGDFRKIMSDVLGMSENKKSNGVTYNSAVKTNMRRD